MIDSLLGLLQGFSAAATPENLAAAMVGAMIGTAVGVLPGMSPTVAIALLLVPSTTLPPDTGLILLAAVFFGTQYGDSLSAILMNVPSEAGAVVLARDGYQMTRQGRPGPALAIAAIGSFVGGMLGLLVLVLIVESVSRFVFDFGPTEITMLAVFGLVGLALLTGGSVVRAMVAMGIGLALPTVGIDPAEGTTRFTFGLTSLYQGVTLVPIVLGLIGVAELLDRVIQPERIVRIQARFGLRQLLPTRAEWRRGGRAMLRGTGIGFVLGLLPGPSLSVASFASYRLEKAVSRRPERFGRGEIEGVAGPGTADNAAVSGNLASLVTIGIPFSPVTGVLYAGFLLHGIQPGPLFVRDSPDVLWGLVAALAIGNVALLVLNFPLVGMWVKLLKVPPAHLSAALAVLILIGSFSLRNSYLDMIVTVFAGVLGYLLKRLQIDRTILLVGLILGPIIEASLRQTLALSGGDLTVFLGSPVSLTIVVLTGLVIAWSPVASLRRRARGQRPAQVSDPAGAPPD